MSVGPHLGFTHVNDILRRLYGLGCDLRAEHGVRRHGRAAQRVTRHIHTRQVQAAPLRRDRGRGARALRHFARRPRWSAPARDCSWRATRSPRARRCTRSARATTRGGRHEGSGDRGDDVRRHARRRGATTAGRRGGRVHGREGHRPRAARALGSHGALSARARRATGRQRRDRDAELHRVRGSAVRRLPPRRRGRDDQRPLPRRRAGLRDRRFGSRRPADERRDAGDRLRRPAPRGPPGPRHLRRSRGPRARRDATTALVRDARRELTRRLCRPGRLRRPAPLGAGERGLRRVTGRSRPRRGDHDVHVGHHRAAEGLPVDPRGDRAYGRRSQHPFLADPARTSGGIRCPCSTSARSCR